MKRLILLSNIILSLTLVNSYAADSNPAATISQHYSLLPSQYNFDNTVKETISDKITRQYIMGTDSMLVKWTLKKGAIIPLQIHESEQITWITSGSVKVNSNGKQFIVKAGEVLILPPYVPHEFEAIEDTIDIDFFTPVRNDWVLDSPKVALVPSKK